MGSQRVGQDWATEYIGYNCCRLATKLQLAGGFFTTEPPRKPSAISLYFNVCFNDDYEVEHLFIPL